MSEGDTKRAKPGVLAILKQVGFVLAAALLGILAWALVTGASGLVMSGSFTDQSAQKAGQDAARYAFRIGGTVGALLGAWFNAQRPECQASRRPGLAGWLTAAPLVLFFIVASLGAK
jgi:hypothetical protein